MSFEHEKWVAHQISELKSGYFYHEGEWIDMNGDGRLDYLTARSNAKENGGELVWFEHPEGGLGTGYWAEHVLHKGPDVMFEVVQNLPGYEESLIIFAAEFFNKKMTVYEIQNAEVVNYRILDTLIDQAYSVHYLDINADGKYELLVNNHEKDNSKAGIFLYEVPSDIFSGVFK